MNENNHTLAHPEIFLRLTVVKRSDDKVKKLMSLLTSSQFVRSPSGCKVPAQLRSLGFASSQPQAMTTPVQAAGKGTACLFTPGFISYLFFLSQI